MFNGAAENAMGAVADARNDSLRNDESWFGLKRKVEAAGQWFVNHLDDFSKILGQISAIAGLISLVAGPFAPLFAGIALAAAIAAFACDLAIMKRDGAFELGVFLLDVAAVGLSVFGMHSALSAAKAIDTAAATELKSLATVKSANAAREAAAARETLAVEQGYTKTTAAALAETDKSGRLMTGAALRSRLGKQTIEADRDAVAAKAAHDADMVKLRQAHHDQWVPGGTDVEASAYGTGITALPSVSDAETRHTTFWNALAAPWANIRPGSTPNTRLSPVRIGG